MAPDGKVWFSGGALYNGDPDYGIAYWDGHAFHYYDPQIDLEMPGRPFSAFFPNGRWYEWVFAGM